MLCRTLQPVEGCCRAARRLVSRDHYGGGDNRYPDALIANDSLCQAEIAAVATRRAQLVAIVELYKARVGGRTVDQP